MHTNSQHAGGVYTLVKSQDMVFSGEGGCVRLKQTVEGCYNFRGNTILRQFPGNSAFFTSISREFTLKWGKFREFKSATTLQSTTVDLKTDQSRNKDWVPYVTKRPVGAGGRV